MTREFEQLLAEWFESRSVSASVRDKEGRYFIVFDGLYEVSMSQVGDFVCLEAEICTLPVRNDESEALLETLMKLQFARAGNEILSITAELDRLTIFRSLSANLLTFRILDETLESFVNALADFMKSLESSSGRHTYAPALMQAQIFIP